MILKRLLKSILLLTGLMPAGLMFGVPSQIGDLDDDGRYTIRDVTRIVNHLQRVEFLPQSLQPFADVNEDGNISRADVDKLIAVILEKDSIDTLPLARPLETSPVNGEESVSLTREAVVRFSLPLGDNVLLDKDSFYATFAGKQILSRVEISADRMKASLFFLENLPDSARVRVVLDGAAVTDNLGRLVDMDLDGEPGGVLVFDFDTATVTPVPSTGIIGTVYASQRTGATDTPLAGVIIEVVGAEETIRAVTGADGTFRLQPVPAGRFFVNIDGRLVTGTYPDGDYYPFVGKTWEAVAGNPDNLANGTGTIYLPLVKGGSLQTVSSVAETRVEFNQAVLDVNPDLAGTELLIPANSLFANNGTRGGRVGIAPVASDRLPEPLPMGLNLPMVITIQTDGATNFDVPVPVRLPNLPDPITGYLPKPGEASALWSFDHDTGQWEIAGPMTVTPDGLWLVTDPGVGVRQPGWHGSSQGTSGGGGGPGGGPGPTPDDLDGDGIPNDQDDDIDGDGIPNGEDDDVDGDGIPNGEDDDVDGDGVPNSEDDDIDGDGIPNGEDNDVDGDGVPNGEDEDSDGDGTNDAEDTDDDNDGTPDNCQTSCVTPGDLSNLGVTRNGPAVVCKDDTISFTANGVVDSGGTRMQTCVDDQGQVVSETEEPDPPGTITYNWVITRGGSVVATGTGATASTKATSTGTYSVQFTASVKRKCLEKTVNLQTASVQVVDRDNFTSFSISGIPAPDPLVQRLQDTINRIPRVNVNLRSERASVGFAVEGGRRDCCKNGQLQENGEWYGQIGFAVSGRIDAQLWGPPTFEESFDWEIVSGTVLFEVGIFVNSEIGAGMTGGRRVNECIPEDCLFGEIKAAIEITTQARFVAIAFGRIAGFEYELDDINFKITAPLKVGVSGSVKYNSNDSCSGFAGSFGVDDIIFILALEVAGYTATFQHVIWESTLKL